jgi:tRNA(fMet)-specific endonuclease VapC
MSFMLDTDICIYIIKRRPVHLVERVQVLDPEDMAISSITIAELQFGAEKSAKTQESRQALEKFVAPFQIVHFDEHAGLHYGKIRAFLEKAGTPIGAMDLLIAAHAKSLSMTLVTNSIREFERVPGLSVEQWI